MDSDEEPAWTQSSDAFEDDPLVEAWYNKTLFRIYKSLEYIDLLDYYETYTCDDEYGYNFILSEQPPVLWIATASVALRCPEENEDDSVPRLDWDGSWVGVIIYNCRIRPHNVLTNSTYHRPTYYSPTMTVHMLAAIEKHRLRRGHFTSAVLALGRDVVRLIRDYRSVHISLPRLTLEQVKERDASFRPIRPVPVWGPPASVQAKFAARQAKRHWRRSASLGELQRDWYGKRLARSYTFLAEFDVLELEGGTLAKAQAWPARRVSTSDVKFSFQVADHIQRGVFSWCPEFVGVLLTRADGTVCYSPTLTRHLMKAIEDHHDQMRAIWRQVTSVLRRSYHGRWNEDYLVADYAHIPIPIPRLSAAQIDARDRRWTPRLG